MVCKLGPYPPERITLYGSPKIYQRNRRQRSPALQGTGSGGHGPDIYFAHLHGPPLVAREGGGKADPHSGEGVGSSQRWRLALQHLVHEILDLGEVSALETLHEMRHHVMRDAFLRHHQNGRVLEVADLDGAFGAPQFGADIEAED